MFLILNKNKLDDNNDDPATLARSRGGVGGVLPSYQPRSRATGGRGNSRQRTIANDEGPSSNQGGVPLNDPGQSHIGPIRSGRGRRRHNVTTTARMTRSQTARSQTAMSQRPSTYMNGRLVTQNSALQEVAREMFEQRHLRDLPQEIIVISDEENQVIEIDDAEVYQDIQVYQNDASLTESIGMNF